MKKSFVLVFLLFAFLRLFAQDNILVRNYEFSQFRFAGYRGNIPIFQCNYRYSEPLENAVNFAFYSPVIAQNGSLSFKFQERFKKEHFIYYLNDDYLVYRKARGKEIYIKKEDSQNEFYVEKIGDIDIYNRTHYLTQGNYFYFSTEINKINYLARVDISAEKPNVEIIPLKGRNPIVYKNWLFYEIGYVSPKYSSPPSALYRVKIGDWRNPELIVNDVYSVGTVVNENIISFRIYLDKEIKHITYNLSDSTYIEEGISSLIKYKGKKYQRTLCKNPKSGKTQLCFEELPELPDKFPYKLDRDIESNHNYFHLPHTEKPFTGTFITDRLMFYAGKDELQNLSKSQLRILRNAFYAREGYDFKSADLRELFSQFDWYKKTLERRKVYNMTNDDIYISPADKERIDLILEIENSK